MPVATGGRSPLTYTLEGLPNGLSFDANSRILSGIPTLAGTSNVIYTVTDSADATNTLEFVIGITANTPPTITGSATLDYIENSDTPVATYSAEDAQNDNITWFLGGVDMASFTIDSSGVLTFNSSPDFENPADSDANNIYEVTLIATDDNTIAPAPSTLDVRVTITDLDDAAVPTAPTNLMAQGGFAQATLTWTKPTSDGGAPITGYQYHRTHNKGMYASTGPRAWYDLPNTDSASTSAVVTNNTGGSRTRLPAVLTYFEVRAVNIIGSSLASNEASATVLAAPTAHAGSNQSAVAGAQVILPGSATDTDGSTIVSYSWTQTGGTSVTLIDADTATATFTAPGVGAETTLVFTLTVTDSDGGIGSDTVEVVIMPLIVTFPALGESTVGNSASVKITFSTAVSGLTQDDFETTNASVDNITGSATTYTITYTSTSVASVELTLKADSVIISNNVMGPAISISSSGEAIMAQEESLASPRFKSDMTIEGITTAQFDKMLFRQGMADLLGINIDDVRVLSISAGSVVVNLEITAQTNEALSMLIGTYNTARAASETQLLAATRQPEATGVSTTAPVTPKVATTPVAPTLDAAPRDSGVILSWNTPDDGGAPITGYKLASKTTNTDFSIFKPILGSSLETLAYTVMGLTNGVTYTFKILATNIAGDGAESNEVSAVPAVNILPTAHAGDNQSITSGKTVTLDGSGSSDGDGTPLTYNWSQTSGTPTVMLTNANRAIATFIAPDVDAETKLVFTLRVSDNIASDNASVTITITPDLAISEQERDLQATSIAHLVEVITAKSADIITSRMKKASNNKGEAEILATINGNKMHITKENIARAVENDMPGLDIIDSLCGFSTMQDGADVACNPSWKSVLAKSSFAYTDSSSADTNFALWGEGDVGGFSAKLKDGGSYDGDYNAIHLGLDYKNSSSLKGVMLSIIDSEIDYKLKGEDDKSTLDIDTKNISPYIQWNKGDGVNLWAMFALGSGDVKLSGNDRIGSSDLETNALALGIDNALDLDLPNALAMTFKSDFNYSSAQVDGDEDIAELDSKNWRLRLALDIAFEKLLARGKLSQHLEIGARVDGGDRQETLSDNSIGRGIELAVGAKYSGNNGTKVELFAKSLIAHSNRGQGEYNISLNLSHASNNGQRGLQLSLRPVWGKSIDKDTWSSENLLKETKAKEDSDNTSGSLSYKPDSIAFRIGYNLRLSDIAGLFKPYSEFNRSDDDSRTNKIGISFIPLEESLELEVFNKQKSSASDKENIWMLQGKYGF